MWTPWSRPVVEDRTLVEVERMVLVNSDTTTTMHVDIPVEKEERVYPEVVAHSLDWCQCKQQTPHFHIYFPTMW